MHYTYNMKYVRKTITITEKQDKWIKDNCINFSRLVQKELDKKIGNTKYTRYITTLPKNIVRESNLLGKVQKARVEKDKIILEKE